MPPDERNNPRDPTPIVGSQTDVAPLGRGPVKPAHEQTADEDRDNADWAGIYASPDFRALLRAKRRFIRSEKVIRGNKGLQAPDSKSSVG